MARIAGPIARRLPVQFLGFTPKRRLKIDPPEQAVAMTRLCWHRFRVNEAGLWLSLIAYILGNLWRRLPPGR
jgi:hypothetical protein